MRTQVPLDSGRHSRENGNPELFVFLDSRFRGSDYLSLVFSLPVLLRPKSFLPPFDGRGIDHSIGRLAFEYRENALCGHALPGI